MTLSLADVLNLPVFAGTEVLSGTNELERREVKWASAVEWPVDGFINSEELILTTGIGCDGEMLARFVDAVDRVQAAGLVISVEPGRHRGAAVRATAARAVELGLPLIELPWSTSFSDVTRAVIGRIIDGSSGPRGHEEPRVSFTHLLLRGDGLSDLTVELERLLDRLVLILSPDLRILAHGPRLSGDRHAAIADRVARLSSPELRRLRALLSGGGLRAMAEIDELELGPGEVEVLAAQGEPLGFLYLEGPPSAPGWSERRGGREACVHEAAVVAALELRRLSREMRFLRDHEEDAVWALVDRHDVTEQIARLREHRAGEWHDHYRVAAGRVEGETADRLQAATIEGRLRDSVPEAIAAVRDREVIALFPASGARTIHLTPAIKSALARSGDEPPIRWGIATAAYGLPDLAAGYERATHVLRVARAISSPRQIASEAELGSSVVLGALADSPEARRVAWETIKPLLEYDRHAKRGILETLEVLLEERGNQSATARRLYLNRHSVIYRVRKIEELTGRSISSADDRILLDLATRLVRMTTDRPGEHIDPASRWRNPDLVEQDVEN